MSFLLIVTGGECQACERVIFEAKEAAKKNNLKTVVKSWDGGGNNDERFKSLPLDKLPAICLVSEGKIAGICYGFQPEEILTLWIEAKLRRRT